MDLSIGSQVIPTTFLASDKVDEVILGIEFMCNNQCEWRFADKRMCIAGESVPLFQRSAQRSIRRIYVTARTRQL